MQEGTTFVFHARRLANVAQRHLRSDAFIGVDARKINVKHLIRNRVTLHMPNQNILYRCIKHDKLYETSCCMVTTQMIESTNCHLNHLWLLIMPGDIAGNPSLPP